MWLGDIPVASIRTNESGAGVGVFYIHVDHLNTPRKITRPSDNAVVWRFDSDPFGNGTPNEDPDGNGKTVTMNLRFPGQYADAETGLYYNYFRYFDPQTGRYITSDPIGLHGGINTYAYADQDPILRMDPLGLSAADVKAIEEYAQGWTDYQTSQGMRIDPGWRNDSCYWSRRFGISDSRCRKDRDYEGCEGQTDNLLKYILAGIKNGKLRLDDEWKFKKERTPLFTHFWLESQSSNPGDPQLTLDPFRNQFGPSKPRTPMGYPE